MAAPTKEMKFCKELFEVETNEEDRLFVFKRREGDGADYIVPMTDYPTIKEACIYVKDCEDGNIVIDGESTSMASAIAFFNESAQSDTVDSIDKSADVLVPEQPKSKPVKQSKIPAKSLQECAEKFPTDKIEHGYIPIYAENLPHEINSLLEIGCWKGNSMRMWRECLPDAKLTTLDLFEEYKEPTDVKDLICFKGDQSDPEVLDQVIDAGPYDVVIDDGSHGSVDQWSVVEAFLRPGTMVVIEDLHCCEEGFWRQGLEYQDTILGQMRAGTFPFRHQLFEVKKGSIIAFIYAD